MSAAFSCSDRGETSMPRSQASPPAESVMCGVLVELTLKPYNLQPISNDESPSAPFIMDMAKGGARQ